ncbi:MAG TPA: hypothetical protein VFQ67_11245 [Allosphingosinicella sp.]|jgi:hypothetical protein|nr:hypothetical protein [Allosphingosinicella sp.]
MNDDHVRAALRRDAESLLLQAPPPDAAALWHRIRRERARRLKRIADICGWSVRAGIAGAGLGVALWAPGSLPAFIGPLVLVGWLSTGICTPIGIGGEGAARRTAG